MSAPRFFAAVMVLFGIEAIWLALSAAYPMAFDENVHFSVIKLYSHQWSPFFPAHSTYLEPFGALRRDPSFLYRYLMSFPYRLIAAFSGDQATQITWLRLINIALFGSSLMLFRRLFLKLKLSPAAVNLSLLVFVLLPVVPLLAAQINYDNLIQPLAAAAMLLALSVDDRLRRGRLPVAGSLALVTICLLGSLVQVEFLVIFAAVMCWLAWRLWQSMRANRVHLGTSIGRAWQTAPRRRKLLVVVPLVVALGLFWQLYGVNVVRYHTPTPACNQVLSDRQCAADANWVRAENALAHKHKVDLNPLRFSAGWAYRMLIGSFYTSSGGASPQAWYLSINPLPVVFIGSLAVLSVGVLLLIVYGCELFRQYDRLSFLLYMCLFYGAGIWLRNFHDYMHLGIKVAINARYLLPVAPVIILLVGLAYQRWLQNRPPGLKLGLLVGLLLIFTQGGGDLTYIAVSNTNWYWHNRASIDANRAAQDVVRPLILDKTPLKSIRNL